MYKYLTQQNEPFWLYNMLIFALSYKLHVYLNNTLNTSNTLFTVEDQ